MDDEIKVARWNVEEAVREIEHVLEVLTIKQLESARQRLLRAVLPVLYDLEGK